MPRASEASICGFCTSLEQVHDHHLHLLLVRRARADYRLLDLGSGVFAHF